MQKSQPPPSRQYQSLKLAELADENLPAAKYNAAYEKIVERECLCNGLSTSALLSKNIGVKSSDKVTICPGPNLAWFSKVSTLKEMADHIYGRINLLDNRHRPHMFLKELNMYLDIFKERVETFMQNQEDSKELKQLQAFQQNLVDGVNYYKSLFAEKKKEIVEELDQLLAKYPSFNYAFK